MSEDIGRDYPSHEANDAERQHPSSWSFDNQYPTSNIFCVISSDDQTGFLSVVTGDSVSVRIIRGVTWQDHRG
jgi:hypothetical protein